MDNPGAFLLLAFFLYWLSEGIGLLFQKLCLELENKKLFNKFLTNLLKDGVKNA